MRPGSTVSASRVSALRVSASRVSAFRVSAFIAAAALGACGGPGAETGAAAPDTGAPGPTCDGARGSATYVMRAITFARAEGGVGWGFDLDGHVSAAGDPEGCGKADLVTPDGGAGVDNAFAGLLPTLEQTEAVAVEGLLQDSISNGELLLMVEVLGIDDWRDDDCVTVRFGPAVGTPLVGTDGTLLDGQTFARGDGQVEVQAAIEDGVLVAQPIEFTLEMQVLAASFEILVTDGALRVDLDPEAAVTTGFFGGGFSIDYMLSVLNEQPIDAALLDTLNQVLPLTADLADEAGACRQMSVTLEYEAIPAFYYEGE